MLIKTDINARSEALQTAFLRKSDIPATDTQAAIEYLRALISSLTLLVPPLSADYIVGTANGTLTAERVATDTATIDVDIATAGQAKWNIIADSVDNTFLANMAQATLKGRAAGAGTGDPTDLTPAQAKAVVGLPTASTDNMIPRFDGTSGDLQTSTLLLGDTGPLTPTANDGIALGSGTLAFSDLFLANGGVANWNNGNYTLTHSAGNLTAAGGPFTAPSFIPSGSTVPSNGMYLPAANTLGWAVNTTIELQLTGTALSPGADGGSSLGTTALGWQNLFGNTGFVLNVENGDWVATHTAGILTVGTGDLRVTTAGTNAASAVTVGGTQTLTNKQLTAATVNTSFTPTANDGSALGSGTLSFSDLFLATGGVLNWVNGNYTLTHSAGNLTAAGGPFTAPSFIPSDSTVPSNGMYLPAANTLGWAVNTAIELQLTGAALSPGADGGSSLGTTALGWQNLFVNTGFVLNVENGDWVATHTAGILTVGTGDLRVTTAGTNTASAVTVGGTQTLTNKTLTNPTLGASYLQAAEIATPSSPAADNLRIYAKDVAGTTRLHTLDSSGTETMLGSGGGGITASTVQAATSGTAIDFSSLPAAIKRITVIFDSVSLSGTDNFLIQLGDSGGIETTGYTSETGNRGAVATSTAGFIWYGNSAAGDSFSGHMTITRITSNSWVASHAAGSTGGREVITGGGRKDLSDELTQIRITRSGTNTFDAGQINIFYE